MVQQLNRFNRPPRPGARYVAAYVGQQYIAGPENQAYTTTEADWKATTTDGAAERHRPAAPHRDWSTARAPTSIPGTTSTAG